MPSSILYATAPPTLFAPWPNLSHHFFNETLSKGLQATTSFSRPHASKSQPNSELQLQSMSPHQSIKTTILHANSNLARTKNSKRSKPLPQMRFTASITSVLTFITLVASSPFNVATPEDNPNPCTCMEKGTWCGTRAESGQQLRGACLHMYRCKFDWVSQVFMIVVRKVGIVFKDQLRLTAETLVMRNQK